MPLVLEEETGKLFPVANRARVVRDALVGLALERGVAWINDTNVTGLDRVAGRWQLASGDGRRFDADAVIIATGGLSVPATGIGWLRPATARRAGPYRA